MDIECEIRAAVEEMALRCYATRRPKISIEMDDDTATITLLVDGGDLEAAFDATGWPVQFDHAGWGQLSDEIDEYVASREWHFERGEWSLSTDGGAIAGWIISMDAS